MESWIRQNDLDAISGCGVALEYSSEVGAQCVEHDSRILPFLRTLDERDQTARRTAAAREYVLAHHSVDRLLQDIDELYRELLRPSAAPA